MIEDRRRRARRWDDVERSVLWAFLVGVAYGVAIATLAYVWLG